MITLANFIATHQTWFVTFLFSYLNPTIWVSLFFISANEQHDIMVEIYWCIKVNSIDQNIALIVLIGPIGTG